LGPASSHDSRTGGVVARVPVVYLILRVSAFLVI
jgi:hypothetical protein